MRYLDLATELRNRIAGGDVGPGGALPSEATLGRNFGVSRVTVRRALELLRDEGLVASRHGSGWFVAVDPVLQVVGRFSTVEAALEAAGRTATREVLEFAFEPAPPEVAQALALGGHTEVLRVRRLNRAGKDPFALVTVWVPAHLGAHLSRADVERATFYDLLPLAGVEPARAVQVVTADTASPDDATRLEVPEGSALLVCRRTTSDREGHPLIVSEHRYPAHLTSFEVELPSVAPGSGLAPAGLKLAPGGGATRQSA
jgi:GntR family transcriptional regulator